MTIIKESEDHHIKPVTGASTDFSNAFARKKTHEPLQAALSAAPPTNLVMVDKGELVQLINGAKSIYDWANNYIDDGVKLGEFRVVDGIVDIHDSLNSFKELLK